MCAPQAADLACSGGAFANALLQRQSASVSSLHGHSQGGTPRMASTSQLGTPTASLDKLQREDMLMHELDQVRAAHIALKDHVDRSVMAREALSPWYSTVYRPV